MKEEAEYGNKITGGNLMFKKTLALVLACVLVLGMTAMPASAENAVVEVKTADELCAAVDALTANPVPTTIKLTADMTPAYADFKDSRNSVIGILPEDDASVLDLNGHTITFSNVKFQGRIIDSIGGGKVCYVAGNKTRLGEACSFPLEFGFEDLVSEIRISNKNATETHDTIRRFPANTRIFANSAIELFFDLLTIGSGCTVESSVTVNATNGIYLEAATAEDLSLARLAMAGVTRIILTADITDENLSVFVPADAVLDFNGFKLTCKGITGKTVDSVAEAAAQAAAEAAAQAAAETAASTPVIAPAPTAAAGTKYTVKDGDCLYAIARSLMGGGANWPALYEANKAVIGSNPRLIYTGTVLTIPGANDSAASVTPIERVVVPVGSTEIVAPVEPAPAIAVESTSTATANVSCMLKAFDAAAKTVTITIGNGWEAFPVSDTLTIDDVKDPALGTAKQDRQYTFEISNGKVQKMTSLVNAQGYQSFTSTASNGNFKISKLTVNADGTYSFELHNDEKNTDWPGLKTLAGIVVYDTNGKPIEPKVGDIVRAAHEKGHTDAVCTLYIQERPAAKAVETKLNSKFDFSETKPAVTGTSVLSVGGGKESATGFTKDAANIYTFAEGGTRYCVKNNSFVSYKFTAPEDGVYTFIYSYIARTGANRGVDYSVDDPEGKTRVFIDLVENDAERYVTGTFEVSKGDHEFYVYAPTNMDDSTLKSCDIYGVDIYLTGKIG